MKSSYIRPLVFAFIASTLLSSCAFLQKNEFAQRKYYNFPRTNHSTEATQSEAASVKQKEVTNTAVVSADRKTTASAPVIVTAQEKKEIAPVVKSESVIKKANTVQVAAEETVETTATPVLSSATSKEREAPKGSFWNWLYSSGGMFILQIFCAIIIPPLGVYLHDNGRTNTWFWVTLVLCILGGGLLGIGNVGMRGVFGGVWFVAALIALLVVFDVL